MSPMLLYSEEPGTEVGMYQRPNIALFFLIKKNFTFMHTYVMHKCALFLLFPLLYPLPSSQSYNNIKVEYTHI